MKGFLSMARCSIMVNIVYRAHFFFTLMGTVLGVVLQFFLWKAIYGDALLIKGMSFEDTFLWVALSSTIFTMFKTYVDWEMCFSIIEGSITQTLIKPTDYQLYMLSSRIGDLLLNTIIIALPTVLLLIIGFHAAIPVGINLLFFVFSLVLSFLMSFTMEFIIGLISFQTNSIWGISTAKDVIVMVMSGAVVPLAFFPDWLHSVANVLPFRAMYDVPMHILLSQNIGVVDYIQGLGFQVMWITVLVFLSRIYYKQAIKVVTVSGG